MAWWVALALGHGFQIGLLAWVAGFGGFGVCLGLGVGMLVGAIAARTLLARAPGVVAMLVFGGLGMMLGWWADLGFRSAAEVAAHARAPLDLLWCRSPAGPASLAGLPGLGHVFSWMNAGMLALGMPAVALARRRFGCAHGRGIAAAAACALAMALGMSAGSVAAGVVAAHLTPSIVVLVDWALMSAGMLAGMELAERAPRWLAQIPRHAASATSAQPSTVTPNPAAPA